MAFTIKTLKYSKDEISYMTSSYKYELPTIDHTIEIPDNCTGICILMIGGGGSAMYENGQCTNGQDGSECQVRFDAPKKDDKIVINLGLGGEYQIIGRDINTNVESKRGRDSVLKVNDEIIAIAKGSSMGIETFENKYANFINVDKESSFKFSDRHNSPVEYCYTINDYNGNFGWGGKGKKFYDGEVYLGAGGHGAAIVWIRHFYYCCGKSGCYKTYKMKEELEQHEYEHIV
jgi:hypothetical protein